jgi:DNA-binding response OmpR family regulator
MMPTALIVEDEPAANQLLAMLVQLKGYQTESAFTGSEAIRKADDSRPDVVFLDLMLPDINGYEVCRALRGRRSTNEIPIVLVTARLAEENRLQGFRAGAAEYVPKPYTPDQIFRAMSRADTWRSRIDELPASNEIAIGGDELACFHQVSDLHRLLLARTRVSEDDAERVVTTVLDIFQRATNWSRAHPCGQVAKLRYELDPSRIVLKLFDRSGWFRDEPPNAIAVQMSQAGFEILQVDQDEIAFVRGHI